MGYLNVTSDSVSASRRPHKRLASTALKIYSLGSTATSLRPRPGILGMEGNIRPSTCNKQTLVKLEVMASVLERSTFLFANLLSEMAYF